MHGSRLQNLTILLKLSLCGQAIAEGIRCFGATTYLVCHQWQKLNYIPAVFTEPASAQAAVAYTAQAAVHVTQRLV